MIEKERIAAIKAGVAEQLGEGSESDSASASGGSLLVAGVPDWLDQSKKTQKAKKEYTELPTLLDSYYKVYIDPNLKSAEERDKALKDARDVKVGKFNSYLEETKELTKETVKTGIEISITGIKGAARGKGLKGAAEAIGTSIVEDAVKSELKKQLDEYLDSHKEKE